MTPYTYAQINNLNYISCWECYIFFLTGIIYELFDAIDVVDHGSTQTKDLQGMIFS